MTNREIYIKIFLEVFNIDKSNLDDTFTFADTDIWNSMSHLTLISELEDAFGIMLDTDDILHFESYRNGFKILERYGISFND